MTVDVSKAYLVFSQAVDMAARGTGNPHARLVDAYRNYLVTLRPDELPQVLRDRFYSLHYRVTDLPPGGEPQQYTAHFKAIYGEEDADILAQIVDMKNTLHALLQQDLAGLPPQERE